MLTQIQQRKTPLGSVRDRHAPIELTTPELARRCAEETSRFLKSGASDGYYCLELFRRAIGRGDEDAWTCLYQQYAPLVRAWVQQQQGAASLMAEEGAASLVNAAFARFACAMTPARLADFDLLEALLKYLKRCVRSAVTDALRTQQARPPVDPLQIEEHDQASDDPADDVVNGLAAQGLWQAIQEELVGEEERVILYLTCVHGMKPREITCQHRRLFPCVEDVYRVKRMALERLRRNARLQAYAAEMRHPDEQEGYGYGES